MRVYARGRGHLVRHTLAAMERRLDPRRFARIHRSVIVNVGRVREVRPEGDRTSRVVLCDDTSLRLSRRFRERTLRLLGAADGGTSPD